MIHRRLKGALGLTLLACVLSLGQLTTSVQALTPNCHGLKCTEQEDCGSKCFCNRPSEGCIEDA